ncbi:hypothetical protein SEPCBS57363_004415 [Sporothrix epigloea]|uniref:Haloacid dehalogenase-like hydrolase n=1 Tax=Sporothrix epigloea TaxID=1892477 RepID=A0ABP0DRW5_9PEZI
MHVVLDFDGTITVDDTIEQLASYAVAFQEAQDAKICSERKGSGQEGEWEARWTGIVEQYLADHRAHKAGYTPSEAARTTLEHELQFLNSLNCVERKSIYRLRDARLFAGMTPEDLYQGGCQAVQRGQDCENQDRKNVVRLRLGFATFLEQVSRQRKWPVSVVSVNWSDAWIRGVLQADDSESKGTAIRVFANKVTASGAIIPNFPRRTAPANHDLEDDDIAPFSTCSDKAEALDEAVAASARSQPEQPAAVVYMGDSMTDVECLMQAGLNKDGGGGGIVMADGDGPVTSKLIQTLVRLGYAVPHVSEAQQFQRPRRADEGDIPRLAWARDFEEILASKILDEPTEATNA